MSDIEIQRYKFNARVYVSVEDCQLVMDRVEKLQAENKRLRKAVSNAREILRILYNDHNISDEDMHDIVTHELEKGSDE